MPASRVILITGAARGIGAELARVLALRGDRLALVGLEPERLAALAHELGPPHAWFECDVTDQAMLERAVEGTLSALGVIDVVVANAGIASLGTVAVTPADALARVIEVNLMGVVRTVRATLPHVCARKGYYLLISSVAAIVANPGLAAYAASKSGVEQFGNALRLELAAQGVGVGTAYPCWIDTDLVRDARHDLASFDEMVRRLPGPFHKVTSVQKCARALAQAVERRKRRVYVPRSVALVSLLRPLFTTRLAGWLLRREVGGLLPDLEREVAELGRCFGANSVEAQGKPPSVHTASGPRPR
jgi:short-subunit dehydrogenase